jgi:hypothetical protein
VAGSDFWQNVQAPRLRVRVRTLPDVQRANGVATCSQKRGEQGKQAAMAKKKRHSRVEIGTTQGEPQSETADRTGREADKIADKIAELELENLRLRQLIIDLLHWDD